MVFINELSHDSEGLRTSESPLPVVRKQPRRKPLRSWFQDLPMDIVMHIIDDYIDDLLLEVFEPNPKLRGLKGYFRPTEFHRNQGSFGNFHLNPRFDEHKLSGLMRKYSPESAALLFSHSPSIFSFQTSSGPTEASDRSYPSHWQMTTQSAKRPSRSLARIL